MTLFAPGVTVNQLLSVWLATLVTLMVPSNAPQLIYPRFTTSFSPRVTLKDGIFPFALIQVELAGLVSLTLIGTVIV